MARLERFKNRLQAGELLAQRLSHYAGRPDDRREKLYRAGHPPPLLLDRGVILVDDGLATGSTMLAAVHVMRQAKPAGVIAAAPVAAPDTCREPGSEVIEMICVRTPEPFHAVGLWYEDFDQTSDAEVIRLLEQARHEHEHRAPPPRQGATGASAQHAPGRH